MADVNSDSRVSSVDSVQLKERVEGQSIVSRWQTGILALTAVIALAAAWISYTTAENERDFEAEIFANQTWESYRRLEMEYIEKFGDDDDYINKTLENNNPDIRQVEVNRQLLYAMLVERLLMAADGVTISLEGDPQWRDSFTYEFRKHRDYLIGDDFLKPTEGIMSSYCTFRRGVRNWLQHGFKDDREALTRLREAEKVCRQTLAREGFSE